MRIQASQKLWSPLRITRYKSQLANRSHCSVLWRIYLLILSQGSSGPKMEDYSRKIRMWSLLTVNYRAEYIKVVRLDAATMSMTIRNASAQDSGVYTCQAQLQNGTRLQRTVDVVVFGEKGPPTLTVPFRRLPLCWQTNVHRGCYGHRSHQHFLPSNVPSWSI